MIKKLLIMLVIAFVAKISAAQITNVVHGGGAGIYVYTAFEPCSPSRSNNEGTAKIKVERRKQGTTTWTDAGTLSAPETFGELTVRYHTFARFNISQKVAKPDILPALWEQYKKYPSWDSLNVFMNERAAALAMGYLFVDTSIEQNVAYEYQLTALDKIGKSISTKTTNAASYPDNTIFTSAPKSTKIEGNPYQVEIEWRLKSTKRPQLFRVYRKQNVLSEFEYVGDYFTTSHKARSDSAYLFFKDVSIAGNQVYYYYTRAVDGYGNESENSDTVITKTYNTPDLLLPQYFIARSLDNSQGVELTWKIVAEQSIAGIEFFKSDKYDGEYQAIGLATPTDTSFIDFGARPGTVYYYYMQVTDRFQHVTSRSARTPALFEDNRTPRNVRNLKAEMTNGKIQVSWTSIEKNIAGYYLYRSVSLDTNYVLVSDFIPAKDSLTVFTDASNDLSSPYGYSYSVVQENTSHVPSKFSPPFFMESMVKAANLPPVTQLQTQMVNGRIMLTWASMQNVSGVAGYNVMRKAGSEKDYTKLNTTTLGSGTNFFTDSTVKQGVKYEYGVQLVASGGLTGEVKNTTIYDYAASPPEAPNAFSVVQTEKGILLTWDINTTESPKEINVYRAERGTSNALKLTTITGSASEYTDMTAQKDKTYLYYLIAVNAQGVESEKSEIKVVTVEER